MTKRAKGGVAVLFFGLACVGAWQLLRPREPLYQGKTLAGWAEQAVLEGHHDVITTDPALDACAINLLRTRDNRLWKPYTILRTNAPAALANRIPEWRNPAEVRLCVVRWIQHRALHGAKPRLEIFVPPLSEALRHDPDPEVRRSAVSALGSIGVFSPAVLEALLHDADPGTRELALRALSGMAAFCGEAIPVMVGALTSSTNMPTRLAAAVWLGRTKPEPDKIVPLLLRGLEDPGWKSEYALALRGYGPEARFAVGPLLALARTNDRAVASVALWALEAVDPEAATKVGK